MIENLKIDEININDINLVDIRTEFEWEDGYIQNAIKLCFVDEDGNYNLDDFIVQLNTLIDKNKKIALICESGNRSLYLAKLLEKENINTINILGGMGYARQCKNINII